MPVRIRVIKQNPRDARVSPAGGLLYRVAGTGGPLVPVVIEERRNKNDKWTPVEVVTDD